MSFWRFKADLPPAPPSPEFEAPWRMVDWSQKAKLLQELRGFNPRADVLKFLVYGGIGAGKSCFINSIQRALLGRHVIMAGESSAISGFSFTETKKTYKLKKSETQHYPFEIVDIRGLEESKGGIETEDLIKILKGHILDGYTFNPVRSISTEDRWYNPNPTFGDKIHCLISVLSAEAVSRMDQKVFDQMQKVRECASRLGIPQVIIMTKVDAMCPEVNGNLRKIYSSKKIKEKVDVCSQSLGISLNSIYPVKNYHAETTPNSNVDVLLLMALRDIVYFANDYVKTGSTEFSSPPPALSPAPSSPEFEKPWRIVDWSQKEKLLQELQGFNPSFKVLKFLLHGVVGAGKSCFINSIQRTLLGRNVIGAGEGSASTGISFTKTKKTYKLKKQQTQRYPFEIVDIRGLEEREGGIDTEDLIKILEGHILDGYCFNPVRSISTEDRWYNPNPTFGDKIHCLISVLSAEAVSRTNQKVFDQMQKVRECASRLGIPQVIIMTKVDAACPIVNGNLRKIYSSKKIKEKVDVCSQSLGISLNSIYPVKNYHEEITPDPDMEVLLLMALRDIVYYADDYVVDVLESGAE